MLLDTDYPRSAATGVIHTLEVTCCHKQTSPGRGGRRTRVQYQNLLILVLQGLAFSCGLNSVKHVSLRPLPFPPLSFLCLGRLRLRLRLGDRRRRASAKGFRFMETTFPDKRQGSSWLYLNPQPSNPVPSTSLNFSACRLRLADRLRDASARGCKEIPIFFRVTRVQGSKTLGFLGLGALELRFWAQFGVYW